MASVIIKRDTLANINATPITDGQLLFSTDQENDNNKIYADVGSDRKVIGGRTEVVDNLTSTNTTKALSANMGKELNENIGDLTTLTTTKKSSVVEAVDELKGVSDEINSNLRQFPDYKTAYTLMNGTGNIAAPSNGWVQTQGACGSSAVSKPLIRMYINNWLADQTSGSGAAYTYYNSPLFRVKKNDVIRITNASYSENNNIIFYPETY